jgi:hypothetical protein
MEQPPHCVRNEAMQRLGLSARRTAWILYEDVADMDPHTKYIEAKRILPIRNERGVVTSQRVIDDRRPAAAGPGRRGPDATAETLENYLNAQPPGRAYSDYRPDEVGPYLFPSPRTTAGGLSHWSVIRILRTYRGRRSNSNRGSVTKRHAMDSSCAAPGGRTGPDGSLQPDA